VQVALADPCCDVVAGRVAFRVDPQAEPGDVVGTLARLLIQARQRRTRENGDGKHQEPALVVTGGQVDAV
jgi:hypothetical protein